MYSQFRNFFPIRGDCSSQPMLLVMTVLLSKENAGIVANVIGFGRKNANAAQTFTFIEGYRRGEP